MYLFLARKVTTCAGGQLFSVSHVICTKSAPRGSGRRKRENMSDVKASEGKGPPSQCTKAGHIVRTQSSCTESVQVVLSVDTEGRLLTQCTKSQGSEKLECLPTAAQGCRFLLKTSAAVHCLHHVRRQRRAQNALEDTFRVHVETAVPHD